MIARIQTFILVIFLYQQDVSGQCSCAQTAALDWSQVVWNDGNFTNNYDIATSGSQTVNVSISISTSAEGTFNDYGVVTPYKDGPGASGHWFDTGLDLGVIFNPVAGQGTSPVYVNVIFDQEVTCLEFDISDIDISGSNRADEIRVTGNNGSVIPAISLVSTNPTVTISNNRASAIGDNSGANNNGSADPGTDNGNVRVNFGTTPITSIRIIYSEISGVNDPAGRGIGLFGTFAFCPPTLLPVKLRDYTTKDKDRDCLPEIRWSVAEEIYLDHYEVAFSNDGKEFAIMESVYPSNEPGIKNYQIESSIKGEGFYQLSEVTLGGEVNPIAISHFKPFCDIDYTSLVYPNPASGYEVRWKLGALKYKQMTEFKILDNYGNRVKDIEYYQEDGIISSNFPDLPSGIYVLETKIDGTVYHERLSILR